VSATRLASVVDRHEEDLLSEWLRLQTQSSRINQNELKTNSHDFVLAFREGLNKGGSFDIFAPAWSKLSQVLNDLSRQRASQGFSFSETASFVFSFKRALFRVLQSEFSNDPAALAEEIWTASELLDRLGLYTVEVFQKTREDVISRQQQEMLELSTPVVELWHGILALPLIGTLDSARTQVVMQNLLEAIVANSSSLAIIDITGVPTVDTLVAQHLLKTVAAARLMGADCIISGIRPQIAQTIIHLGVDLTGVVTKATLADAFRLALQRRNLTVAKA
jgi:rsbT co-antagonist protein RsbR